MADTPTMVPESRIAEAVADERADKMLALRQLRAIVHALPRRHGAVNRLAVLDIIDRVIKVAEEMPEPRIVTVAAGETITAMEQRVLTAAMRAKRTALRARHAALFGRTP